MFVEVVGLREILGKVGTVLRATVSLSLNTLFLLTMEIVKTLVLSIVRSIANIKRVFFYQIFQLLETRRQRVVELYLSSSKNLYGIILYFMNECYYRNFNGTFCLSQFPGLCFHLWQKKEKKNIREMEGRNCRCSGFSSFAFCKSSDPFGLANLRIRSGPTGEFVGLTRVSSLPLLSHHFPRQTQHSKILSWLMVSFALNTLRSLSPLIRWITSGSRNLMVIRWLSSRCSFSVTIKIAHGHW